MKIKSLLLTLLVVFSFQSIAQTYSDDREKFTKELDKNLRDYGKGDYRDFMKKEFIPMLLETSDFPDSYFKKMVATCNLIHSKKLKVYPEVYNYVYSVTAFIKGKQSQSSFDAWHESVDKMLNSRYVKKFSSFIDLSAGFFSKGMISSSANYSWYYRGGEYEFVYTDKAYLNFKSGNLVCLVTSTKRKEFGDGLDSICVKNTTGQYDPILKKWQGHGGKVTWMKVGLEADKNFAELMHYKASMKSSDLRVDTVMLTTTYFSKPLMGSLTDRAAKINRPEDKVYPRFLSFEKKLLIKNIVEGVDYIGGFALQGERFIGAGTPSDLAQITIQKEGTPFIVAKSTEIIVTPKKISSQRTRIKVNLATGDSIVHPGLEFLYELEEKTVEMIRTKIGVGQSPFEDSYHKLDIYVPKVAWEVGADNLDFTFDFGTSRDQRVAYFESKDYFNARQYDGLQGNGSVHPLSAIWSYCYKFDVYVLTEGQAASALHRTILDAKPLLIDLSALGFITYDTEGKTIVVNDKLENFVKAKSGKKDFDNIVFKSDLRPKELKGYSDEQIKKDTVLRSVIGMYKDQNEKRRLLTDFAVMDLSSMDLDIEAVDNISASDKNNVIVFPDNSEVKVRENRNFNFTGWLNAGKMELNTEACHFDYDEFKFKVLRAHETLLRVRPLRPEDGRKSIPIISRLIGVTGELFVDDPSNRSGNSDEYDDFPKMITSSNCKIFYNSENVFRGSYDSTRFYYTVFPFELDSLDGFYEKSMRFEGELVSAGIFPVIKEPLKIMPDYSLGFSMKPPEEGYKFYGTDATYGNNVDNKVILSHNGLQGAGEINFVNSTSKSTGFNFLPDSTIGVAEFKNRPRTDSGVELPDVYADQAFISYIPKEKILKASSMPKKQIKFFGKEAKLKGTAIVTEKEIRGAGVMTFKNATMISHDYSFTNLDILADTSSFSLRNDNQDLSEDAMAFKTDNCNAHVSFKDRKGVFVSNDGTSEVVFPVNQYLCRMDKFTWFMDEFEIAMERKVKREAVDIDAGVDLLGPNFFSLHPKQDSLNFMAPKAKFNLQSKTIVCKDVEFVDIADARIYPDSMKLVIRKKAKLDKLKNSKVVANYITKYHTFIEADVEIKARREYKAKGKYPYYDKDSNLYHFVMKDIGLDTSFQTKASGRIKDSDGFKLSDDFDFYGDVSIRAANPKLQFAGATRINHECEKFERNWMAFSAQIDPSNIQIPVSSDMKSLDGDPISAGIVWRNSEVRDSISVYPTFLSQLVSKEDEIVITAEGLLQYDAASNEYQISSEDKLANRGERGNYIALNTKTCSMEGDGVISLGMQFGTPEMKSVGKVNYDQEKGETTFNITTTFDIPLNKGLMQSLGDRISNIEGLKGPRDLRGVTIEQALLEWDGLKAADDFKTEYIYGGKVKKIPESINNSMTITGLKLKAYEKKGSEKGLITTVDNATLVNFYGEPVMKTIPIKAFFIQNYTPTKKKNDVEDGDEFIMKMAVPGGADYWFYYTNEKNDGQLELITNDEDFNADVDGIKEDKRKAKNFIYKTSTQSTPQIIFSRVFK